MSHIPVEYMVMMYVSVVEEERELETPIVAVEQGRLTVFDPKRVILTMVQPQVWSGFIPVGLAVLLSDGGGTGEFDGGEAGAGEAGGGTSNLGACRVGLVVGPDQSCTVSGGSFRNIGDGCFVYTPFGSGRICGGGSFNLNGLQGTRVGNDFQITAVP